MHVRAFRLDEARLVVFDIPAKLIVGPRLDVAAVVLVKVAQLVVHVHGRRHGGGHSEVDKARVLVHPGAVGRSAVGEAARVAIVPVVLDLDHLVGLAQDHAPDRDKDDAHYREGDNHGLGREDRPPGLERLLAEGRVEGLLRSRLVVHDGSWGVKSACLRLPARRRMTFGGALLALGSLLGVA